MSQPTGSNREIEEDTTGAFASVARDLRLLSPQSVEERSSVAPLPVTLIEVDATVRGATPDITERKQIEDALSEKNLKLEKASKAKDRFLATMSHELRTPLNAILGFVGTLLLRLPGSLTPEQERQLQTIRSNAKHLLSLINDLLDLTKIESGRLQLHLEPVVCQNVISDVIQSLHQLAEEKDLETLVETPAEPITIQTDQRALHQILINLMNNAIKFTERGGIRLTLTVRDIDSGRRMEFSVADTGIGIRPEDQHLLFAAFPQIQAGGKQQIEGTGLGLHLSQKLATLLGGEITLRSVYGQGSTFTLALQS